MIWLKGPWPRVATASSLWTEILIGKHGRGGGPDDDIGPAVGAVALVAGPDAIYSTTLGYAFPPDTVAAVSLAHETVDGREGVYAGVRLTQTLTSCSRCLAKGRYF